MPGPRHRNKLARRLGRLALITLGLGGLVLSGCYYGPDHPRRIAAQAEPPYQDNSTPGTRVIVYDGDGEAEMKLRVRSRRTRVYDDDMISVGQLRTLDDQLERRSRDGQSTTIVTADGGGGELTGAWRLTRQTDDHWQVADGDHSPLAELRRDDDDRWTLIAAGDPSRLWRVDRDRKPPAVITDDGEPRLTVPRKEFSDPKLLLLTVEELSVLDRYTLAAFAEHRLHPTQ